MGVGDHGVRSLLERTRANSNMNKTAPADIKCQRCVEQAIKELGLDFRAQARSQVQYDTIYCVAELLDENNESLFIVSSRLFARDKDIVDELKRAVSEQLKKEQ